MIHYFSEDIDFNLADKDATTAWIENVLQKEGREADEVTYIFCSDEFLLSLNQQFLEHNYYTDILTFDHQENPDLPLLGDIYISIDRVRDNAQGLGISFEDELNRVIIHGILHLVGYDDRNPEQKASMRKKEDACLSLRK